MTITEILQQWQKSLESAQENGVTGELYEEDLYHVAGFSMRSGLKSGSRDYRTDIPETEGKTINTYNPIGTYSTYNTYNTYSTYDAIGTVRAYDL